MPDIILQNHLLLHTNARLGIIVSQQTEIVRTCIDLDANIETSPELSADITVSPELSASVECACN